MGDELISAELLLFAEALVDEIGEGNTFEFEGQTYVVDPNFREKLRALVNRQLEEAISND